jgi:hypothetical protein
VLRAIVTKAGFVAEDEVELDCHNCGELLVLRTCDKLEIGPWLDGELDDPELDRTLELGVPLDIAPVPIGRVRQAKTVTFGPRTVREAMPLFSALAKDPLDIDEAFVTAMGIRALGPITEPSAIAHALSECDDEAFTSVTDAFLETHYPLRLASDVICTKCKAKNTALAPSLREFELGPVDASEADEEDDAVGPRRRRPDDGEWTPLPPLEEFVELAHEIAEPLIAEIPGETAMLVVEDGTPAVDDGGVPLLGSYVPPPPKDLPVPTTPPTVTIYYRTFAALEREEGPYDWRGELTETIEHELEHHVFFLRGDDPMDEEEHAEIDREAVRVIGRGEAQRRAPLQIPSDQLYKDEPMLDVSGYRGAVSRRTSQSSLAFEHPNVPIFAHVDVVVVRQVTTGRVAVEPLRRDQLVVWRGCGLDRVVGLLAFREQVRAEGVSDIASALPIEDQAHGCRRLAAKCVGIAKVDDDLGLRSEATCARRGDVARGRGTLVLGARGAGHRGEEKRCEDHSDRRVHAVGCDPRTSA